MAKRSTYTQEQREQALALYAEHGPAEASRRIGIPRATISKWASRAGLVTVGAQKTAAATKAATARAAEKRAALKPLLLDKATDLINRMDEPMTEYVGQQGKEVTYERPPASDCKHYATAAAILIDKLRLEEGQATSRDEHVTQSDFDREVAELEATMRAQA
jgi:transposase-like protein